MREWNKLPISHSLFQEEFFMQYILSNPKRFILRALGAIAFCGIIFLSLRVVHQEARSQSNQFTGHEVQAISLTDASALTRNFRATATANAVTGEYFSRDAL